MDEELKLYEMILDSDEDGVYAVSLVNEPAIESEFIALSAQKEMVALKVLDDKKRTVTGALLIPNKSILRRDPITNEPYNIFFTAETIEKLSQKFMRDHNQSNITLEHQKSAQNIDIVESWIKVDEVADKSVKLGLDVPVGTWLCTAKINNEEVWENLVLSGEVSGFSIEADLKRKDASNESKNNENMSNQKEESILAKIKQLLGMETVEASAEPKEEAKTEEVKVEAAEEAPEAEIAPEAETEEEVATEPPSREEFEELKAKYDELAMAVEAIAGRLSKEPEEEVEASAEETEEKVEASAEVEEKVEFATVAKTETPSVKVHQWKKFDRSMSTEDRLKAGLNL